MIRVDGNKIKELRKKKGLTQNDLSENVCKQATISNIERKDYCNNLTILGQICSKLEIELADVLIDSEEKREAKILDEVESLCTLGQHAEALSLLDTNIISEQNLDEHLLAQYYYLKGITLLIGKKDTEKCIVYFHRALNQESVDCIYRILAKSSMGIAFSMKKEYLLAEEYYNDSVKLIDSLEKKPINLNKVFYNSAKLASDQLNFKKALILCNKGIQLNQEYQSTELLDFLLYEKAFNLYKLGNPESIEIYNNALFIAKFNNNEYLPKVIETDLKNFLK
ncbi:helix-turn-helix domain-containing protein [Enterococcus caccae]|uniref:HTH cro/C1-type domain-containing protein n=1 Tax=Enterococcus caccae ATCC BAA-1240 TaxID=1158612 RepID=R3WP84_9ENTE|nr:helix-turn-helix transcriptional regulator [Enterococcus caccae]EOL43650.1 hypothetical protein UC7_02980 [Enterococcus caccae ATCC BAA-1240]EOT67950.1 hypothetical protein I580_00332 [Enterococcus caccae ATCC BAA-1240]OJG28562.1 hypothetical protein RU98_GL000155 [Enterococcus caccae]